MYSINPKRNIILAFSFIFINETRLVLLVLLSTKLGSTSFCADYPSSKVLKKGIFVRIFITIFKVP